MSAKIKTYRILFYGLAIAFAICTYGNGYLWKAVLWMDKFGFRGGILITFLGIVATILNAYSIKRKVEQPWLLNALLVIVSAVCVDALWNLCKTDSFALWSLLALSLICLLVNVCTIDAKRCKNGEKEETNYLPFFRDYPTDKNDYKRKPLAIHLVHSIIADSKRPKEDIKGAYTINIDEEYGQGKSSFFLLMKDELKKEDCIHFTFYPWRSPNPSSMTKSFFAELENVLSPYVYVNTIKQIREYAKLVVENVAKIKGLDVSSVIRFSDNTVSDYYNEIVETMSNKLRRPIVVMVDDVDRLHKEELESLLCLVRNSADFPYLYFVLAADRQYLIDTLAVSGRTKDDIDFYLEKIINLNMLFHSVDYKSIEDVFVELLEKVLARKGVNKDTADIIYGEISGKRVGEEDIDRVFNNFRSVNRFFSMLNFDLEEYDNEMFKENLYVNDFIKVELIKFLRPDVYKMLRDYPWELLESSQKDTRYVLVNDCKVLVSKSIVDYLKQRKNETEVEQGKAEVRDEYKIRDLSDKRKGRQEVIADYVCQLMNDMFYDDCNYKEELSIRKYKSYDFYFSPGLHHDLLTYSQFMEAFSSKERIAKELPIIIKNDKGKSYLRNMRQLFQHPQNIEDKTDALNKMFLSLSVISDNDKTKNLSEFNNIRILFEVHVKYVVYEFFGASSLHKMDFGSFVDFLKEENFLYGKMSLVERIMHIGKDSYLSSEERQTVMEIICRKSIECISQYETVDLKEIMAIDEYCALNYGSFWIDEYRKHLKECREAELLYLLRSCISWSNEKGCYRILPDVENKLFTNERDRYEYLQMCRKEPEIQAILDYFLNKKNIAYVHKGGEINLFGI